jgi:hypothetical protein
MSVAVLMLFFVVVIVVAGSLMAMYIKDKPFYGAMGICVLTGPGSALAFLYTVLA